MDKKEIREFAKKLIQKVRDNAVRSCDSQLSMTSNSPIAKRWREIVDSNDITKLQKTMIVDCIDDALFHLLDAIDNNQLKMIYLTDNNKRIDLAEEGLGEMSGSYASNDWTEQFSSERYSDNFLDL